MDLTPLGKSKGKGDDKKGGTGKEGKSLAKARAVNLRIAIIVARASAARTSVGSCRPIARTSRSSQTRPASTR